MSPTFTDDDIGKTVESTEGVALGVIADVDEETAYVELDSGIMDSIKAIFDWESNSENRVSLGANSVRQITDNTVRLEEKFPEKSITTGSTERDDPSGDDPGNKGSGMTTSPLER